MNNNYEQLKKSATFNLSLSSKELFHTNLLSWLAMNDIKKFCKLINSMSNGKLQNKVWFHKLQEADEANVSFNDLNNKREMNSDNSGADAPVFVILREKMNFDFSIFIRGSELGFDNDKKYYPVFVLENKVKSIPYPAQLDEYSEKIKNLYGKYWVKTSNKLDAYVYCIVLSLCENVPGLPFPDYPYEALGEEDKNRKKKSQNIFWYFCGYKKYSEYISDIYLHDDGVIGGSLNYLLIKDYANNFIANLYNVSRDWLMPQDHYPLQPDADAKARRIDDIRQKMIASNIAADLEEYVKQEGFDVMIKAGFTHSTGLVDIHVWINNDYLLKIQIQGNDYRHVIEFMPNRGKDKKVKIDQAKIDKNLRNKAWELETDGTLSKFFSFNNDLFPKDFFADNKLFPKNHSEGNYKQFGNSFLYTSKHVNTSLCEDEFIGTVKDDIKVAADLAKRLEGQFENYDIYSKV